MKIISILLGVGGSGVLATGSWFVYDKQLNPTFEVKFGNANLVSFKTKYPSSSDGNNSYKGAGCLERFFPGIEIRTEEATGSSMGSNLFTTGTWTGDFYGCFVSNTDKNFKEITLSNGTKGLIIWLDKNNSQSLRMIELKKESGSWKRQFGLYCECDCYTDLLKDETKSLFFTSSLTFEEKDISGYLSTSKAYSSQREWSNYSGEGTGGTGQETNKDKHKKIKIPKLETISTSSNKNEINEDFCNKFKSSRLLDIDSFKASVCYHK